MLTPNFLLKSPIPYFHNLDLTFSEFDKYLVEVVEQGMRENDSSKNDILSCLIRGMDKENPLSNQEILANVFIFLIAGHETTAHGLGMLFRFTRIEMLIIFPSSSRLLLTFVGPSPRNSREMLPRNCQYHFT